LVRLKGLFSKIFFFTNKPQDVCAKLRLTDEEVKSLGPEFEADWNRDFVPFPTKPVMLCGVVNAFLADPSLVDPGQYVTMVSIQFSRPSFFFPFTEPSTHQTQGCYTAYPYSRGRIHINNPTDVLTGYDFDTGFLNHPSDIKKQRWAYKMSREIARRLPYYAGELELGHPKFPAGSAAALEAGPIANAEQIKDIEYTAADDEAIDEWIRGNLSTTWHSLGTCKMAPREKGGVVDGNLNVYGTEGLKVADLSMVPENVGANTNNTALVVGEKAAVIIARELGVKV
jgi:alcohol oxidase